MTARDYLELLDARRVEWENALDADAGGHLPDREGRTGAASGLANHDALEDLDSLLLALPNSEVDVDRVAHAKRGTVKELRLLNRVDFRNGSTHR
jgi:hypothetical protein